MTVDYKMTQNLLKSVCDLPYETGGIIGSTDGSLIDMFVLDKREHLDLCFCSYSPNVVFLNERIELWQKQNIKFEGIFHTHFSNIGSLSCADRTYINKIMQAMPESVDRLYFPIVLLPKCDLICYIAEKTNEGTVILSEKIETK